LLEISMRSLVWSARDSHHGPGMFIDVIRDPKARFI
jgi:hypothetical protein